MSGIRDIVGGRSGSYEDSLMNARQAALDEMSQRASKWVLMLLSAYPSNIAQ